MVRVRAVSWESEHLRVLDQTRLPFQESYLDLSFVDDYARAITRMQIRGAPLIGIVAAYGMAQAALNCADATSERFEREVRRAAERLAASRPTAMNLFWALERMRKVMDGNSLRPPPEIAQLMLAEARAIHREQEEADSRIGKLGATLIPEGSELVTICNTGELATGGQGTAFSILRQAHLQRKLTRVWVPETRPRLQGRLTAWELSREEIPFCVIADAMIGWLFRQHPIAAGIVGADRVAANGDVANKIGTYQLAVLCARHESSFIVAAPESSFDPDCPTGDEIIVEQRSADEIRELAGNVVLPEEYPVWNPAFDITPAELVSCYVSEKGIKPGGRVPEEAKEK